MRLAQRRADLRRVRLRGFGGSLEQCSEHLLLDERAQALAAALRACGTAATICAAGGDAHVGHQQNLFEILGRVGVDLPSAGVRRIPRPTISSSRSRRSLSCCDVFCSPCLNLSNRPNGFPSAFCLFAFYLVHACSSFCLRPMRLRIAVCGSVQPDTRQTSRVRSGARCHVARARAPERSFGRPHAFGDHLRAGDDIRASDCPRCERDAEPGGCGCSIAGAREDEIAKAGSGPASVSR